MCHSLNRKENTNLSVKAFLPPLLCVAGGRKDGSSPLQSHTPPVVFCHHTIIFVFVGTTFFGMNDRTVNR